MTLWFADELKRAEREEMTAGVKARDDLDEIFLSVGMKPLATPEMTPGRAEANPAKRFYLHWETGRKWEDCLTKAESGDTVFIQFPPINTTIYFDRALRACTKKGIRTVLFIHDLEALRLAHRTDLSSSVRKRLELESTTPFAAATFIVAHNQAMADYLVDTLDVDRDKIVILGIFDYLVDGELGETKRFKLHRPAIVSGNLRPHKAQYVYKLPPRIPFNLYGVDYEGRTDEFIKYFGAFDPDKLADVVEGSFGIVWDGVSVDTCNGVYGEYLKINNPHKTSFYLSAGLPVIIWEKAALAPYIKENGLGITIKRLCDIPSVMGKLSEDQYDQMKRNVAVEAAKLRSGFYTKRVIDEIESRA